MKNFLICSTMFGSANSKIQAIFEDSAENTLLSMSEYVLFAQ